MDGIVWACERPLVQLLDDEGRIHCDDGPAILCRDGFGVWAIHGVRVPKKVIESPESLSAEEITGERNVEVRRVMIDRYTPERYLREADAVLVDEVHEPPFPGLIDAKLWRLEQEEDEPLVMLECRNSTVEPSGEFKVYWLRVPPDSVSAHGAAAWTFGETERSWRPLVES